MPLTLEMPDLSEDQRSPILTLADIEEMNARCAAYLDRRVAEERERTLSRFADGTHRVTLTRGESDFAAAERQLRGAPMSGGVRPFTPTTAPRQGGKPGRKAKLSAQAGNP